MPKKNFRSIYDLDIDVINQEYRYLEDTFEVTQAALSIDELLKTGQKLVLYHDANQGEPAQNQVDHANQANNQDKGEGTPKAVAETQPKEPPTGG